MRSQLHNVDSDGGEHGSDDIPQADCLQVAKGVPIADAHADTAVLVPHASSIAKTEA